MSEQGIGIKRNGGDELVEPAFVEELRRDFLIRRRSRFRGLRLCVRLYGCLLCERHPLHGQQESNAREGCKNAHLTSTATAAWREDYPPWAV